MKTRALLIVATVAAALLIGLTVATPAHAATTAVRAFNVTGGTPSPTDNDFTRIYNAVHGASNGDVIKLQGTFNWAETNAASSWAAAGYMIQVPDNLSGVTLTADSLGTATIQGPGDLPTANLEAFIHFGDTGHGNNQNWTISNLRILDFDWSIGFENGIGNFNGTKITNNYIRMATDLNGVAAPTDVNQNIGIHFSFGSNETISYNTIDIPGDGVSDPSTAGQDWWTYGLNSGIPYSSDVAMQSNTTGTSTIYNGLLIDHNTIRVLHAQSANPEKILGIWENGWAVGSNITVSNNQFINLDAGNDPTLNRQMAFRLTSQSSASATVTYSGNTVQGASIGFGDIAPSNPGQIPVIVKNNTLTNTNTGFMLFNNEVLTLTNNKLTNTGGIGTGVSVPSGATAVIGTLAGSDFISGFATGVSVTGGSATIRYTALTGNGTGLVQNGGTAKINYSNISGNSVFGVNNVSGATLDATNNWWGGGAPSTSGSVNTSPAAAALAASVTASTHEVGETGTLDTNVTANGLYGAQLTVNHDNSVVNFTSSGSTANNVGSTPPWGWDLIVRSFTHPVVTQTVLAGTMQLPTHTVGANLSGQSIATWKYTCVAPGTSTLMYDDTAGTGTLLSDKNGFSLPAALIGDSVTCTAATASVDGYIALQGRLATDIAPKGWYDSLVTLTCTDVGTGCAGYGPYTLTTDDTGHYALVKSGPGNGIAVGTYAATVTRHGYLGAAKASPVTISTGTNQINDTSTAPTLLGGDADSSGIIDINDLSTIGTAFGQLPVGGADTGADINGDNIVNIFDLVLAGGNFGISSSSWTP